MTDPPPTAAPSGGAGPTGADLGGAARLPGLAPGTTLRFALLLMIMVTATVSMLGAIFALLPPQNHAIACDLAIGYDPNSGHLDNLLREGAGEALERCVSDLPAGGQLWAAPVGTAAVLVIAFAVYWWLPRWRSRRSRIVPLSVMDPDGAVQAELAELARQAGLAQAPTAVVDPTRPATNAVTYGRPGSYTVCLRGGLVLAQRTDPAGFRGVILHEYAHVRNRDVAIGYAVVALWRTFAVLVLAPFVAVYAVSFAAAQFFGWFVGADELFWPAGRATLVWQTVAALFLVVLVQLARADILRHRELHADADAVALGADRGIWDAAATAEHKPRRRTVRQLGRLWRTHPSWLDRRRSLDDPAPLFALSPVQLFLIGAATLLLHSTLVDLIGVGVASWLVAVPVAGIVVIAAWRSVGYAVTTGRPTPGGGSAGCWLGLGLVFSELSTGGAGGPQWLPPRPAVLLLLPLAAILFVTWVTQCARLRLASWTGGSLRLVVSVALAAAVLVAAAGLDRWESAGRLQLLGDFWAANGYAGMISNSFPGPWPEHQAELSWVTATLPDLALMGANPLALGAAAVLWLLPLAWWARRPVEHLGVPSLLRTAVLPGLVGALGCVVVIGGVMAYQHSWRPPLTESRSGAFGFLYLWWVIVAIWGVAALISATVSLTARRYALLGALIAAALTQLGGLAGWAVLATVDGCLGPLQTMGYNCRVVPSGAWPLLRLVLGPALVATFGAALIAAGGTLLVSTFRWLAARSRPAPAGSPMSSVSSPPPTGSPALTVAGHRRGRRAGVATLLGAGLLATATALPYGTASGSAAGGLVPPVPAPRPSTANAKVRAMQLLMWFKLGGQPRIIALTSAYLGLNELIDDLAAAPTNPNGTVTIDVAALSARCRAVLDAATDARDYLPVPDTDLQRSWSDALLRSGRGAEDCLRALAGSGDSDRLTAALSSLIALEEPVGAAAEALNTAVTDALRYWPGLRQ